MLRKIQDLLDKHGELTFQQVCHELNVLAVLKSMNAETPVTASVASVNATSLAAQSCTQNRSAVASLAGRR